MRGFRNATAKTPALSLLASGVVDTVQVCPRSAEWKTRASSPPPLAIHASRLPATARHCPLAEKPYSFGSAGGMPSDGTMLHVLPPSWVSVSASLPSTGSLTASPFLRSKNDTQL